MSYFPTHKIRDFRHPAIMCEERAVFALAFADRQQSPDDLITASIGTIAEDAGVSRKTAQRIVSWGISVGILSVHFRNGFRCYGFHLEALLGLPVDTTRNKARVGLPVPSEGPTVPSKGPADLGGHDSYQGPAVPWVGPGDPVQCPAVPCSVPAGPPKGQSRDNQGTSKGTVSARGATPATTTPGPLFELGSPAPTPRIQDLDAAPLSVRPETLGTVADNLPEQSTITPLKGKRKASTKSTSSAERASRWPDGFGLDAEMVDYAVKRGMTGPVMVADEFERFENFHKSKGNKFVNWKLAFYNWVRNWEDRKNKSAPYQNKPRNAGQSEMEADFFEQQDRRLAREMGL